MGASTTRSLHNKTIYKRTSKFGGVRPRLNNLEKSIANHVWPTKTRFMGASLSLFSFFCVVIANPINPMNGEPRSHTEL
jgi:hypothetical protein